MLQSQQSEFAKAQAPTDEQHHLFDNASSDMPVEASKQDLAAAQGMVKDLRQAYTSKSTSEQSFSRQIL